MPAHEPNIRADRCLLAAEWCTWRVVRDRVCFKLRTRATAGLRRRFPETSGSHLTESASNRSPLQQAMERIRPYWDQKLVFLSQVLTNFGTVGAIAPSSPLLAKAIVRPLRNRPERPISVLEVGAGTGVFTSRILKFLGPGDQLDVYESNPRFCRYLSRFLQDQDLQLRGVRCNLHNADVRQLKQARPFDFIVCGLPFNSFDVQTVDEILEILMSHLAATGVFAYFEYSLSPAVRSSFLKAADRDRLRKVNYRIGMFVRKHQFDCRQVWWNFPPARARYCRKASAGGDLPGTSRDQSAAAEPFAPPVKH